MAIALIVLGMWYVDRRLREDRAMHVAVGLMAFGAMAAVSTALSRLQIGIDTAMSSRYVVLTAPVVIGIYLVLVRLFSLREAGEGRVAFGLRTAGVLALPCLLAAVLSAVAVTSDIKLNKTSSSRRAYYVALKHMTCDPDAYSNLDLSKFDHFGSLNSREKAELLAQIADLRRAKLSVFSGGLCWAYARAAARGPRPESSRHADKSAREARTGHRVPTAL